MLESLTVREIAKIIDAEVDGDETVSIHAIAAIDMAGPGQITFADRRRASMLQKCQAAAAIVGEEPKDEKALMPIEFTHCLDVIGGWKETDDEPSEYEKVAYLGKCASDGDMFAAYKFGEIHIYKGHINDGVY